MEAAVESDAAVERCLVSPEPGLDGELTPVARVVVRRGASRRRRRVDAALQALLPPVMVPVEILVVDTLATTPNGKLLRS